jgi:hypothetical protein
MQRGPAIDELRRQVANVLSNVKSYELPGVCARYALEDGENDEAHQGKFRYAYKRLSKLKAPEILSVAHAVLEDFPDDGLAEQLAKFKEASQPRISEITRRRVLEVLDSEPLSGKLGILEFLKPLWDLGSIPSIYDLSWERTFQDDVIKHCIDNDDWSSSELLLHLGVLACSQAKFFALLERAVHPLVRDNPWQRQLVDALNNHLGRDGFELRESGQISKYPVYAIRPKGGSGHTPADKGISDQLEQFTEAGIHELWEKALERRAVDPEGAITIGRTMLERTCKHILDEVSATYSDDADLSKLWGLCAEELRLAPSQHTEHVFKAILGNCQSVVNYLGTIRNKLGDAHGQGGRPVKPKARHAQLAVNLAGTMATFLLATWLDQPKHSASEPDGGQIPRRK